MSLIIAPDLIHFDWIIPYLPLSDQQKHGYEEKKLQIIFHIHDITEESGGMSATMKQLIVNIHDNIDAGPTATAIETFYYILKTVPESNLSRSLRNKGYREASFYRHFLPEFNTCLPHVIFTWVDEITGNKVIIMEDLSKKENTMPSNYFFSCLKSQITFSHTTNEIEEGERFDCIHNRLILPKIVDKLIKITPLPSLLDTIKASFSAIAKIHRRFFKQSELLSPPLSDWLGKATHYQTALSMKDATKPLDIDPLWQQSQERVQGLWQQLKQERTDLIASWNPLLTQCIESSLKKVYYEDYISQLLSSSWTMIHGDFHAGNIYSSMVTNNSSSAILLDWEMVQIGSPAQDITHYFITYVPSDIRRVHEKELLQYYYSELTTSPTSIPSDYSYDQFYEEYRRHGIERWIWLYVAMWFFCSEELGRYYHDQLLSFIVDHNVTPDLLSMPRV
eukprot:gene10357-11267_t